MVVGHEQIPKKKPGRAVMAKMTQNLHCGHLDC